MIPNKVVITGYKRFKKSSTFLDRKLIAIVGPNEAGKSSFLNALMSLEDNKPYSTSDLTKGIQFDDEDSIVKVEYLIEKKELEVLKEFDGIGKPRYYNYHKVVNGTIYH